MRQVAAPLGGRGKKFRFNMKQNLKAEGRKVAEWCRLAGRDEVLAQVAPKVQNGRPKGGEREAARQLGLDRYDVRRAIAVVALFLAGQR